MAKLALDDYPGRFGLVNELHARPFPELTAPCRALHLAIMEPENAAERDRDRDRAHLIALLDRYGAPHPPPGASHYSGQIGRGFLKWELHTEFVTYTLFAEGVAPTPFAGELFALFPADWLAAAPGRVLTSALVRIESVAPEVREPQVERDFPGWFVPESLAVSRVVDDEAVIAGDFRVDENGHSPLRGHGAARHRPAPARAHRAAGARDRDLQVRGDADPAAGARGRRRGGAARPRADRAGGADGRRDRARARDPRPAAEDGGRDRAPVLDQQPSASARPAPMPRSSTSASRCCARSGWAAARPSPSS